MGKCPRRVDRKRVESTLTLAGKTLDRSPSRRVGGTTPVVSPKEMGRVGAAATTQAAAMVGVVGAGTEAVAVGAMVVARAEVQAVAVEAAEVEAVIPRP